MPVIKVEDIAYVRFSAPDLSVMRGFLEDFGMSCFEVGGRTYGKGTDGRPFVHVTEPGEARFLGVAFRAKTMADLYRLAVHEHVLVEDSAEPGGGKIVRLIDPDGYGVEIVAGQSREAPEFPFPDHPFNTAVAKPRLRKAVRLDPTPAHIRRIGHAVLKVRDFRTSEKWYKDRFGFLTSDEVEAAKDVPLGAFMRCDRGDKPADHHSLFLAQLPGEIGLLHAAFEVANLDDLMLGHQYLKSKQHKAAWGVGRHIMGSQVFDYWKDPFGNELEHWTDGDLFTAADPPQIQPMSALLAVQWGSPNPMFAGKMPPPPGLIAFITTLNIRIRRLFRRKTEESAA
ncbi:VOC family protein [Sphingorhabdus sp. M41]|uniref:VOC family protein n=1 Tax=Sphingorhabdus sp. M41 TaxID=1806885 RepID=UPI00078EC9BE|nr:VOC family protein [Sphingorhabdus sp. M41]AMO72846.1 glyoxalase [Sphingorhabdus sp. M41]